MLNNPTIVTIISKLRTIIRNVLIEGKIEDLQKKYPDVFVEELANFDSSATKKYLEWMVKQYVKGHNVPDIRGTIDYFHRNVQKFPKRDINAYKDLKDLENEVKGSKTPRRIKKKFREMQRNCTTMVTFFSSVLTIKLR